MFVVERQKTPMKPFSLELKNLDVVSSSSFVTDSYLGLVVNVHACERDTVLCIVSNIMLALNLD